MTRPGRMLPWFPFQFDGIGPSSIRLLLEFCGVSVAHNRDFGRDAVDFGKIAAGELDGGSAKVLLQPGQLGGSRDRHDPPCLSQEPGKRQLGWGCALWLTDSAQSATRAWFALRASAVKRGSSLRLSALSKVVCSSMAPVRKPRPSGL